MKQPMLTVLTPLLLCVWVAALPAEEKRVPRPQSLVGFLAKVEADKLTLTIRADSGERTEILVLTKDTKVRSETAEDEKVKVKVEGREREITRPKAIESKASDLKSGQLMRITFTQEKQGADKIASDVLVLRQPKPKERGEK